MLVLLLLFIPAFGSVDVAAAPFGLALWSVVEVDDVFGVVAAAPLWSVEVEEGVDEFGVAF